LVSDKISTKNRRRNFGRQFHTLFGPKFDRIPSEFRRRFSVEFDSIKFLLLTHSFYSRSMHIRYKMKLRLSSSSSIRTRALLTLPKTVTSLLEWPDRLKSCICSESAFIENEISLTNQYEANLRIKPVG